MVLRSFAVYMEIAMKSIFLLTTSSAIINIKYGFSILEYF